MIPADAATLRRDAETAAGSLPPLLARAVRLAQSVSPGVHGRRRTGPGDTFWQFRHAIPGDPFGSIDWRRSAKTRIPLVRETEWEAAQAVWFWVDRSEAMAFSSSRAHDTKAQRASLLALALAVLLVRSGERVGLLGRPGLPAASSEGQLVRMAAVLTAAGTGEEFGQFPELPERCAGVVVGLSDCFAGAEAVRGRLRGAIRRGVTLCLLQITDPHEERFPYAGRVRFESPAGSLHHRADAADDLAERYRENLARLRADLAMFLRRAEGRFGVHRSDRSARQALVWLNGAVGGGF